MISPIAISGMASAVSADLRRARLLLGVVLAMIGIYRGLVVDALTIARARLSISGGGDNTPRPVAEASRNPRRHTRCDCPDRRRGCCRRHHLSDGRGNHKGGSWVIRIGYEPPAGRPRRLPRAAGIGRQPL